jgi:hypothetical protein
MTAFGMWQTAVTVGAALLCGRWQVAPVSSTDGREPAAALLAALDAHDRSIEALVWDQLCYKSPSGTWICSNARRRGQEPSGAWFTNGGYLLWNPQDLSDQTVGQRNAHRCGFAQDERMFACDLRQNTGIVGEGNSDHAAVSGPLHWLGRFADFTRARRLAEYLGDAESLEYLPPSAHLPWPGLLARTIQNGQACVVEVRVDPDAGYAPRLILTTRPDLGVPVERLEVIRFSQASGVHVPTLGLRTVWALYSKADTPDLVNEAQRDQADRERSFDLHGLPPLPENLRVRMTMALRAHSAIFDSPANPDLVAVPLGAVAADGAYMPEVVYASIASVNAPIPPLLLHVPLPAGATLYDFTRDRRPAPADTITRPRYIPAPE